MCCGGGAPAVSPHSTTTAPRACRSSGLWGKVLDGNIRDKPSSVVVVVVVVAGRQIT